MVATKRALTGHRARPPYVYTGNIHDEATQSTYCRACGSRVIGRDWYEITSWNLTRDGHCKSCGAACAGVFDAPPGSWGRHRRPPLIGAAASR